MKQETVLMSLLKLVGIMCLSALLWIIVFSLTTPAEVDTMVEPFPGAVAICGFTTSIILFFSIRYNALRRFEQRIGAMTSNIEVLIKRNSSLLDKANRFVDKHQQLEKETIIDIAQSSSKTYTKEVKHTLKSSSIETSQEFGQFLHKMPELLANQNVERLLNEIIDTENNLAQLKFNYNADVEMYNAAICQFPISLIAKIVGLKEKPYYQEEVFSSDITDEMLGL